MPVFRFNKAFNVGRKLKVFLNLQSGLTRGAVPDAERYKKHAQKLRDARQLVKEQRKKLKEQAETLRYARRHLERRREELRSKNREIFWLKNELREAKEQVEGVTDDRSAAQVAGESEAAGTLPDFVIIGAAKAGTTSLYDLLTRHPHVECAALKELNYFDDDFEKGIEWYKSHFPSPRWKDGRRSITGEASPRYLFHPSVPERMAKVVPQARLIVLLRNPVDRAYSHYQHRVRTARENLRFEEVVEAERKWLLGKEEGAAEREEARTRVARRRVESNYLSRGIYVDQLLRWSEFYSKEQMLVLKSEDFFDRTLDTMKLVLDFLDLRDWEPGGLEKTLADRNEGHYKEMDPVTRQRLEEFFEPHNQRLYEYLGVDLGW